jgi:hypothetical protein
VPLFRREKLHERLAREAGILQEDSPEPADPRPSWGETGIHGVHRPRRWDAVVTAEAPDLDASEVEFVVLSSETVLLDADLEEQRIEPLAEAAETVLEPPYRAQAVRRHGDVWAVAVRSIEVLSLPDADGEELTLSLHEGSRTLTVDGRPEFGGVPSLERAAGERFESYVARASRLDGDVWEVTINPL